MSCTCEMTTEHPQVVAEPAGILVDEEIAYLLELLWQRGITTFFSCQGSPKHKDQTVWHGRRWRGYILMQRDEFSMNLVKELLDKFPVFRPGRRVSWQIEFDNHPEWGARICLRFPKQDISRLILFLKEM